MKTKQYVCTLTLVPKLFLGVFALVLAVFFLLLVILDFLQQPQLPKKQKNANKFVKTSKLNKKEIHCMSSDVA